MQVGVEALSSEEATTRKGEHGPRSLRIVERMRETRRILVPLVLIL
jgi:hypothetical protein